MLNSVIIYNKSVFSSETLLGYDLNSSASYFLRLSNTLTQYKADIDSEPTQI